MFGRTSLLKATALALPFSLAAAAAHAASIAETVQQNEELSTFAKAMAAAKFDQQLSGDGPYTVFAPTDQAFEQLPEGVLDALMKQENQAQLTRLLEQHVVEGKAIATDEVLGKQSQIDPMSGDGLTIDGTSQVVLLVPAASRQADGQQGTASTPVAEESDMPMTEHQQQALESQPAPDQQQTAAAGTADMPATQHQQQVIQDQAAQGQGQAQEQQAHGQMQGQGQGQEGQQAGAQTPTAQGSDMPMSPHQQQALESQPAPDQQQMAAAGTADMPATQHQQQVIQDPAGQGQGQAQEQQAQGQMQGQQAAASTPTAQGSDMPMSPHQQQALESQPAPEQQQTAAAGAADMPATQHQQQVIKDQPGQGQGQAQGQQQAHGQMQGQQGQQGGAQTPTAQGSDMPMSPHQQQTLESQPAPDQQQTAAAGAADMPATQHQQQVIQEQPGQGQAQGQQSYEDAAVKGQPDLLREATVVGADIQADNGVIHVIDAVLLPQDVLKMLEEEAKQGQG
jgi:uncharacterized surface protein with fasciclin (FAS1) repeats